MPKKPTSEDFEKRTPKHNSAGVALLEEKEIYQSVISKSPVGISIYDQTGQCVEANDSIARFVGATKEQVLQQNYNDIESWQESGLLDKAKNAIKEKTTNRHELLIKTTFGVPVKLDCHLVPFASGGLLLMATDITERKMTEVALRESEERLKSFYNAAFEGIAITDQGKFVDVNNRLCKIYG